VGNGNVDVGRQTPTRKPDQSSVERLSGNNGSSELRIDNSLKTGRPGICGAMSQQGGDFCGNVSAPQGFVHLVGCHDPNARLDSKVRQYPTALKR
jgi:hypothetical protein